MEQDLSEAELEQRRQAARKHGIVAFEARGEESLEPTQVSQLAELRQMVKSEPGRIELREELTARMGLICDLGFGSLYERYGDPTLSKQLRAKLWDDPVIKRLATYANLYRRLLESFPLSPAEGYGAELEHIKKVLDAE